MSEYSRDKVKKHKNDKIDKSASVAQRPIARVNARFLRGMKTVEKILLIVLTILAFIPLLWFCGFTIMQAIHEMDYLAVVVLGVLTLSLVVMGVVIVYESLKGE